MTERKTKHIDTLFSLEGKVALVSGGARDGFGRQIVEGLAEAGAHVVLTSRNEDAAQNTARQLQDKGLSVSGVVLDLQDETSVKKAVSHVVQDQGAIHILFNNAADNHLESFETVSIDDWNRVLHVNITGSMLMSRMVGPMMKMNGQGTIVNISSIYGVCGPDQRIYGDSGINTPLVYGVTKAAIVQMTRYLATYWAPTIRVNCITPGGLFNDQDGTFLENYCSRTPLGRMANQNDLKGAAVYLASEASAWVTGQNLIVDGGWTVW